VAFGKIGGGLMASDREQEIRQRAYAIWEHEGHPRGRDLAHWFRAEAEINWRKRTFMRRETFGELLKIWGALKTQARPHPVGAEG
jgi:hypothetical protein